MTAIAIDSAATIDRVCAHCGALEAVAVRHRLRGDPADAVAVICGDCCGIADAGRYGDRLGDEERAELRRVAHHVGRMRGAA